MIIYTVPTEEITQGIEDALAAREDVAVEILTAAPYTYIGRAAVGSSTSASVWQIKRVEGSSDLIITWADGDTLFDNVWDLAATLTYI
jgi:hypothetical protein